MGLLDARAKLSGKVAVVIGGAGGLGRAITLALAQSEVDIALCDIDGVAIIDVADEITRLGRQVFQKVVDVRDRTALDAFWTELDGTFARVDILINVVGGIRPKVFLDTTPEEWDETIRLNFLHVVQSSQQAVKRMQAGGRGGTIINLTTVEAHRAAPRYAVYSGLKAAVTNFARTLAVELGPLGIRVNNVAPDTVPTPGLFKGTDPSGYFKNFPRPPDRPGEPSMDEVIMFLNAQAQNAIPMRRNGTPADIENCVLFLASDLSSFMTGMTLHPDGGALASSGWFYWPDIGFRNRLPLNLLDVD
jgi:NAD(P)-dependent dehydrogenase (short-subunit alcohol dehydrogenase family)